MKQEIKGLKMHHVVFGWLVLAFALYALYQCSQPEEIQPVSDHVAELRWEDLK